MRGNYQPRHRKVRVPARRRRATISVFRQALAYIGLTVAITASTVLAQAQAEPESEVETTGDIPVVRPHTTREQAYVARSTEREPYPVPYVPPPPPEPQEAAQPVKESIPDEEVEVVDEPEPEPVVEGTSELRGQVIAFARSQIGDPYVYGGNGPDSWDCSGLTQAAFRSVGINIPRVSGDQHGIGQSTSIGDLSPGDLVAWDGHVAIYTGNNTIVEAAKPGTDVRERKLADNWFDDGAWGVRLDYSSL